VNKAKYSELILPVAIGTREPDRIVLDAE